MNKEVLMTIKTEMVLPNGKSVKCQCGRRIFTVGKNMQLVISYLNGKCLDCGATFVFDKLYMDDNQSLKLPIQYKE